ncbi:MAG: ABC transporter ATP-binding protein [Phycisphaerales bacterium]|jgi:lipoprotein-releasing system ATP-binding protein|nr:ABC transporter ATP-binding protein [Phycisphaerales bacterium]
MTPAALEAVAVTKHYRLGRQEIPVLRGIDLAVAAGESVALLGASGAGKSTLLHVLGLLDAPSGGEVRYDGRRVDDLPVRERAALRHRHVGFVFQFYHLIPELTALQNVQLARMMAISPLAYWRGRKQARAEAEAMLARVGLQERMRHRPAELSGGERQRVAIARALLARPRALLADEPTGNLDSHTASGVVELMFEVARQDGLALLLVTHDEELARRCKRTVRMKDGRVVG